MIDGRTVCMAISGDPRRSALSNQLFAIYQTYSFLDEIYLFYRKNPAQAFNAAARRSKADIFIGIGGDILVGENELLRFTMELPEIPVVFMDRPLRIRGQLYHPPWTINFGKPFIDGLFRVDRILLFDYPMSEETAFHEDYSWGRYVNSIGLRAVGIAVPAAHVDYHTPWMPRFRVWVWAVIAPKRFHPAMRWWTAPISIILSMLWDFDIMKRNHPVEKEMRK